MALGKVGCAMTATVIAFSITDALEIGRARHLSIAVREPAKATLLTDAFCEVILMPVSSRTGGTAIFG